MAELRVPFLRVADAKVDTEMRTWHPPLYPTQIIFRDYGNGSLIQVSFERRVPQGLDRARVPGGLEHLVNPAAGTMLRRDPAEKKIRVHLFSERRSLSIVNKCLR
jgi:hypothetical protein